MRNEQNHTTWTWWAAVAVLIVPCGGCGLDSAQRIAALQTALEKAQFASAEYAARLDVVLEALDAVRAQLDDPNLAGETTARIEAELADLQAKYAALKGVKQIVDKQVSDYTEILAKARAAGDVDIAKELQLYGQGVGAVAPALPPPFNAYAALAGALLTAAGGAAGAYVRGRAAKKAETAIKEIVAGGEEFQRLVTVATPSDILNIAETFKGIQHRNQSPATEGLVKAARAELAQKAKV